jgi:hypothetical protein
MMNESIQQMNPINDLPIEILCEIFSRSVDQSSARVLMQPNTQIAPMLLCQVCAAWRALVLSTPPLWSHLRFELPLNWHSNGRPYTWDREAFLRRLEWLRWWRGNLALIAPYLQIELRRGDNSHNRLGRLSKPTSVFLLELMSSAQYLSVGRLYRYLVQRRREAGYVVRIHPRAHTIVSTLDPRSDFDETDSYNQYLTSVLTQTRSTLRHVVVENIGKLRPHEFENPLNNWSTLTHLSIHPVIMHLNAWSAFIRSLNALQSGSFSLRLLDNDVGVYVSPPIGTLPCLSVLHVSVSTFPCRATGQYPLKAIFDNLRLPALHTLSLKSQAMSWHNSTAITEVHAALLSAPALTTLALGILFLGDLVYNSAPKDLGLAPIRSDVEPLAAYAPRLEHISFVMATPIRRGAFSFVGRVFAPSRWLDLKNAESTIREVTFVASLGEPPDDLAAELLDRNLLLSEVRGFVKDETTVAFEDEDPVEVCRAVWGW